MHNAGSSSGDCASNHRAGVHKASFLLLLFSHVVDLAEFTSSAVSSLSCTCFQPESEEVREEEEDEEGAKVGSDVM